ncbi:MAG: hypothetical protein ACK2T2_13665, partial [Anaerolineales bacterium]
MEDANRFITIPEALDLKAIWILRPASKADVAGHMILEIFSFHAFPLPCSEDCINLPQEFHKVDVTVPVVV